MKFIKRKTIRNYIIIISCLFYSNLLFSQEKDTTYVLCGEGITWPYYYPDLTYKGGFWEIKQHFNSNYPTKKFQSLKNNTGIITIQFKVNCNGETGDFVLQQCDFNYQKTTVNKKITTYLLNQTKLLNDWIPAKDKNGEIVNSHTFFSFRIKDGVLLEILPK